MPQNITVGYEGLQQSSSQLKTGKEELIRILSDLRAVIDSLTQGGFKTRVASGRFSQHYRQWTESTSTLLGALDDISRAIADAQSRHQQADSALAEGANALGNTGGGGAGR